MLTMDYLIEGSYYCIKNHDSINSSVLFKAEKLGCTHKENYAVLKAILGCNDNEIGDLILVKDGKREKKYRFQLMAPPPTSCC